MDTPRRVEMGRLRKPAHELAVRFRSLLWTQLRRGTTLAGCWDAKTAASIGAKTALTAIDGAVTALQTDTMALGRQAS